MTTPHDFEVASHRDIGELAREVEDARREGRLILGEVRVAEKTPEELDDLQRLAAEYLEGDTTGERSVSITLRMPPRMLDAVRLEAHRLGARGYQTLIKQWIAERLASGSRNMVSLAEVARLVHSFTEILQTAGAEQSLASPLDIVGMEDAPHAPAATRRHAEAALE